MVNIQEVKQMILNISYPIGAIYITVNSINPSEFFGGEWMQIKDRFLLSCGDNHFIGEEGGEEKHVLTQQEMPSHTHNFIGKEEYGSFPCYKWYTSQATGVFQNSSIEATKGCSYTSENTYYQWYKFNMTPSGTISSTGNNQAHNNMPPYLSVYMWQRIK